MAEATGEGRAGEGRRVDRRALLAGLGGATVGGLAGAGVSAWLDDDPSATASDGPTTTFVLDPGADADPGSFRDWEPLVAALGSAPPGDKWIEVRRDALVPPGDWDLAGAGFRGDRANGVGLAPNGTPVVLRFADGARLEDAGRLLAQGDIVLCSDSAEPVIGIDDERSHYFADDAWVTSTAGPFFEVTAPAGTLVLLSFRTGSGLVHASTAGVGDADVPSLRHRGQATLIVAMASGNNIFDDDTVEGTSVVIAAISPAAGVRQADLPRSGFRHAGTDTVMELVFSTAVNVSYRPGQPAHWTSGPTDVAAALDELAARLDALER